jgi:hypothetical protein
MPGPLAAGARRQAARCAALDPYKNNSAIRQEVACCFLLPSFGNSSGRRESVAGQRAL